MADENARAEILIVYGSTKGRTKRIAILVEEALKSIGISVAIKNAYETKPAELTLYPYVILGSSTYGQGDLQLDFRKFELGVDEMDLTGCKAAVFGSGNSRYTCFFEAVDILGAKLNILGAQLLVPGLRQDMLTQTSESEDIRQWVRNMTAAIMNGRKKRKPQAGSQCHWPGDHGAI